MDNKKCIIEYIDNNKIKYSKFINRENNINDINEKDINLTNKNKTNKNKTNIYISIYSLNYFLEYEKLYNLIQSINY